jgi:hypothetical protein
MTPTPGDITHRIGPSYLPLLTGPVLLRCPAVSGQGP